MKNTLLFFIAGSLCCISCKHKTEESSKETTAAAPEKTGTILYCTGQAVETPHGDEIYRYTDTRYDEEHVVQVSVEQDSFFMYETVKSKEKPDEYMLVDVSAFAYKDMNPSTEEGVYTSEYDLDLTDGKKEHQTVFFIKAKNEERIFKQRTYTCIDPDGNNFSQNDLFGANIACSSMEKAKEMVEKIRAKLPK